MQTENRYLNNQNLDFHRFASKSLFAAFKKIEQDKTGKINIALSGGKTPLPILELLIHEELNWSRYNFFLVDERFVASESPSSNFGNIQKVFFSKIISANFSVVKDGISFNQSVIKYKDEIIKNLPINVKGFPLFDLILLGMGEDGHIASLFPGTLALLEKRDIVVVNDVPQYQTKRITLTYPVLLNAKEVIVIIKGEIKEKIKKELYSEKQNDYPICKLINEHPNLRWLIG